MKKHKVDSRYYINRELSWLEFNGRVLEEAIDESNPLFERLKFLSIVSSNLDEFFMVRVASLWDQVVANFNNKDASGLNPIEQILRITERVKIMFEEQYNCYNHQLIPKLKSENITILKKNELNDNQLEYLQTYFWKNIYPVLTPIVIDQSRPFPLILSQSLNIALIIESQENKNDHIFGIVQVPKVLNRMINIPSKNSKQLTLILLEDVIKMFIDTLFIGHKVDEMGCFRIIRNADLTVDEEGAEDLLETIQESLRLRKKGNVVRLECEQNMSNRLVNILIDKMEVYSESVYILKGPLDLTFLMKFGSIQGYQHLKYPYAFPQPCVELQYYSDIFKAISKRNILLHHPYESFNPVIQLIQQAAIDPNVLAIKQTLYRVSKNSPIIKSLIEAAENGKQVTVLVELKARFDEEKNINWARKLEEAGCNVIYGLVGIKTHAKILLVVRREGNKLKRYVHMGTGNYNDSTARQYTDMGLLTSNEKFGEDASTLFNMLSGHSLFVRFNKVYISPGIGKVFEQLVDREIQFAKQGKTAKLIAKMNSLVDEKIIAKLYEASKAGVKINLIVRGICCLKPGIKDISENIEVRSIVGRYLEHSRVFYFHNGGDGEYYLSSSDWMPRNFKRRVELLLPIEDIENKNKIMNVLMIELKDTEKSRIMNSEARYIRPDRRGNVNSQEYLYQEAKKRVRKNLKHQTKFVSVVSPKLKIKKHVADNNKNKDKVVIKNNI